MGLVLNNWKKRKAGERRVIVDWAERVLKDVLEEPA